MGFLRNAMVSIAFKFILLSVIFEQIKGAEDKQYWRDSAREEIINSLNYKWNTNKAKNVIIFMGDGMSPETITASRIYNNGEESYLSWEKFPHVGLLKTYDSDKQVPDSASTATAIFTGVKTNYGVAGLDARVEKYDCEASLNKEYRAESIISWGQAAGKDTGFVTTARVTHATPSALYARSSHREWECDGNMPEAAKKCKDIGRQLIEDEPGRNIKVIMGGGRQMLQSNVTSTEDDPIDLEYCYSVDGRDLIRDWQSDKAYRNLSASVVQNTEELTNIDVESTDCVLGIFANEHMSMDWKRNKGPRGQPSLEQMTTSAIKILQKSKKGFILVVEGGLIDIAHHHGHAGEALQETVRFSEAINAALGLVDTRETLIIVTSDHGHAMTMRGISDRGNNILGISENSKLDNIPYTTLGYATGGPANMAYEVYNATVAVRKDPSMENTTAFNYSQQAGIITDEGKHSGVDVAVFAIGPYAHLFHSTHEQNFVAHVAAYSAKIGEYYKSHGSSSTACAFMLLMAVLPFL